MLETTTIETKHASMILEGTTIKKCHINKTKYADEFNCSSRNTAEFVCRLGVHEIWEDFAREAERQGITLDTVRKQLLKDMHHALYEYVGGENRWDISDQTPDNELNFEFEENDKIRKRVDFEEFDEEFKKQYKYGTYSEFIKSENGINVAKYFTYLIEKTKTWELLFDAIDTDTRPGGYCREEFSEWVSVRISSAIEDVKKVIMAKPEKIQERWI